MLVLGWESLLKFVVWWHWSNVFVILLLFDRKLFLVKYLFSFKIWNKKLLQNKHGVLVLTRASLGSSLVLKYFWVGGWHPTSYSYLLFICYQTHSFTCSRLNSPCPCRRAETYSCEQSWLFLEDATRPLRQLAPEHPRFPELWNTFEKNMNFTVQICSQSKE